MSAETLRKAARIVRERGLAKGAYRLTDGRVCAEGAMSLANGGPGSPAHTPNFGGFCRDADALEEVIGGGMIVRWNDAPERTADEVIAALEAAAARLEATA